MFSFDKKWKFLVSGLAFGILAAVLALMGNPKNMAICVACFIRDMAGSLGLHQAAVVQYYRPEIVGFVLGAFLIAIATKEFKVTGGSSPAIRFILGMIMMIGALAFLGCPLRMVIRMSAGDLNAYVACVGFIVGILVGAFFLKKGFTLGRAVEINKANGFVLPGFLVLFLILSVTTTLLVVSEKGPGSMHAPVAVALIVAILLGALAQKNRICFAGSIRDLVLLKDASLFLIIVGLFIAMLVYNVAMGTFNLSFAGQPVAHSDHVWSVLGMFCVGFAATLAGGCPYRQLVLAGQGSADSAMTFFGLLVGAGICHNFKLAGAATSADAAGGVGINGRVAIIICIIVLFAIALTNNRKSAKKA